MHPVHVAHQAAPASEDIPRPVPWPSEGWAGFATEDGFYFPNGLVASSGLALSPVTQPDPMHGPPNQQLFQTSYAEPGGPFDEGPVYSREQGIGRSPGQQWPHMPHVEAYNFESTTNQEWRAGGPPLTEHTDREGWVLAGPGAGQFYYYGLGPDQHTWHTEPMVVDPADSQPYMALSPELLG